QTGGDLWRRRRTRGSRQGRHTGAHVGQAHVGSRPDATAELAVHGGHIAEVDRVTTGGAPRPRRERLGTRGSSPSRPTTLPSSLGPALHAVVPAPVRSLTRVSPHTAPTPVAAFP